MNTDEKIAAYSEKVEVKKKKLDEINTVIEKKKAAAAALKADIDALSKNIFELEAQRLFSMLKDKGIGIGTVIEAVSTGIFDDENSAANSKENGAINSTIEQEENKNEKETCSRFNFSSYGNIYARRMRKQQRKQHSNKQRKCIFRI